MTQIYVDGQLTYDRRLPGHDLIALSYTAGLNKAGTATITMPPGHPAYDAYKPYKPVVEIYDDGVLVFRGRALKPADNFLKQRTLTCEGERCFFRDAVMRPYLYQEAPAVIFAEVIGIYNSQVEPDKQFVVGTVTVTDANDYIRLENSKAEQVSETIDKLVERCGGYIVFTTNADGDRVVNWYEAVSYRNRQTIDFGGNLLDLNRSTANEELATRIIPYGAQNEETGDYLTIESVNNGLDYIEDAEAIALRGIIAKPMYWDDITEPLNLLRKAQEALAQRRNLITSLTLTATDLSVLGTTAAIAGEAIAGKAIVGKTTGKLPAFREGDLIHVRSKPHGLDDEFLLTDRSVDLLNKGASNITMGKEQPTLTGLSNAGDKSNLDELRATERKIQADYTLNIAAAIARAEQTLSTLIEQTSERIKLEVSETYTTNDEVTEAVSTGMTQLSDSFTFTFSELRTVVDENDAEARAHITEQEQYIRFKEGVITLGEAGNAMTLELDNDLIVFKRNGATFGWWDGVDFHTGNIVVEVNERAQFGNFAAVPRKNGHLSWLKVKN